jgi:type IV pilus assembly protein PilV
MTEKKSFAAKSVQKGTVIVETLVAILIFSVGVLGIVGMQGNMIKNTAESKYRADASNIARATIGAMWADIDPASNLDTHLATSEDISMFLPGGKRTVRKDKVITDSAGSVIGGAFTIIITWQAPGEPQHTFTTVANIAG